MGFLFVCGVARSGTTAFADLLNLHARVAIGQERFKSLPGRELGPALFTRERFFDFRPGDTSPTAPKRSMPLADKYDDALWVGDKLPRYYRKLRLIFDRLPGALVFYIVREPDAVARSWQRRAENENDRWPAENGYEAAMAEWQAADEIARNALKTWPSQFFTVRYEDLFGGTADALEALMVRLGLELSEEQRAACLTRTAKS